MGCGLYDTYCYNECKNCWSKCSMNNNQVNFSGYSNLGGYSKWIEWLYYQDIKAYHSQKVFVSDILWTHILMKILRKKGIYLTFRLTLIPPTTYTYTIMYD